MCPRIIILMSLLLTAACSRPAATPAVKAERLRQRADELHEKAVRLQSDPRKAVKAAALHRESARLRPPSDPRTYECYVTAGQILVAAGRIARARELMLESAEFALARNDTVNAARSYADVVLIAAREDAPQRVVDLAARFAYVLESTAVPRAEREALQQKISQPLAAARAAVTPLSRDTAH